MGMSARPIKPLTEKQKALVEENRLLIYAGVKKYGRMCAWRISKEELTLEFGLALCKAARSFDRRRRQF